MFDRLFKSFKRDQPETPDFKPSDIVRRRIIFEGHVQGVGFRFACQQNAMKLNLCGWVKNLADGSVLCEIEGESDRIDFFIRSMEDYSVASIDNFTSEKIDIEACDSFKIVN